MTDAILDSSTVPEDDATEWDGAGGLSAGVERMVTTTAEGASEATHKVYAVASGGDSSVDPTTDDGTNWTDLGSTNRWKLFNSIVQDVTSQNDGFEYVVTPDSNVTGVGIMNANAGSIAITVDDPVEGIIFDETFSMVAPISEAGWWPYLFEPVDRKSNLYVDGIPPNVGAEFTVEFIGDGAVSAGILKFGYSRQLGESTYGANFSIIDYSTKEVTGGQATISQGPYRDVADVPVAVPNSAFSNVKRILADYRATPAIWAADENRDGTIIYGYYDRFDIMIANPALSELVIRIEGLI
jgi:hypothetical protein